MLFSRRPGVKSSPTTNDARPPLPPTSAAAPIRSVIETGLCIVGDLESEGDVLVNGRVQGNIVCKTLIVGAEASIAGGIVADEAVIRGKVKGVVRAGIVRLEATGRIEGDLYHSRLGIEAGAVFEGTSHNRQDPKSAEIAGARQAAKLRAKAAEMLEELREKPEAEPGSAPRPPLAARRRVNGRKPMTTPPPLPATTADAAAESISPTEELPRRTADGLAG